MTIRTAVLVLVALVSPLVAAQGIHKWVDADGKVHFGDRPPGNVASEVVVVRPNVYETPVVEKLAS